MYEWLLSPHLRRSSLVQVETSIRRGQFDGEKAIGRRQALCERLAQLDADPSLKPREGIRLARIVAAIEERTMSQESTA